MATKASQMLKNSTLIRLEQDQDSRPDLEIICQLVPARVRVLDLGCGDGTLLERLIAEKDVVARGIELSERGLRQCIAKGLSVRQGDLDEGLADYPDGSFDVVILSQTLPYLDNPARVLSEMLRVGRSGIVSFFNMGYWKRGLAVAFNRQPEGFELVDGLRARPISLAAFRRLCRALDLRILQEAHTAPFLPDWFAETGIFVVGRNDAHRPTGGELPFFNGR